MEYLTVVYYHPAYLTYMQSTSYWAVYSESSTHAELDESQAGIKIAKRNIKNLRYTNDTTLREEEESEKVGLKLNIRKIKIMA